MSIPSERKSIWLSTVLTIAVTIAAVVASFVIVQENQKNQAASLSDLKISIATLTLQAAQTASDTRNLTTLLMLGKEEVADIRKQQVEDRRHCDDVMTKELDMMAKEIEILNRTLDRLGASGPKPQNKE